MGAEIGQWNEWDCKREIEWFLTTFSTHYGIQQLVKDLNHFYLEHPALWEKDFNYETFQWVDFADVKNSVISYLRKGKHEQLLCVHNCTPAYHEEYNLYFGNYEHIEEIFSTDAEKYGGSGKLNINPSMLRGWAGNVIGWRISIAPLATMIFRIS